MRFPQARLALVAFVLTTTLGLVGCSGSSKEFTPEQFGTVTKDMPEAKVAEILGAPRESIEVMGSKASFWETKGKYYSIEFKNGKVEASTAHKGKDEYDFMRGLLQAAKNAKP